jgi:chloramphenicol 3-O-phosphotransferase
MHHVVAAFTRAGTNVIVDEMLLDRRILSGSAQALAACHTYLIKVQASLPALEEREAQRGNPRGLARGHYAANDVPSFDWLIDTTSTPPVDAARELASWLQTNPRPAALQHYAT